MAKVSLLALACVAGLGLSGSLFAQSCAPSTNIPAAGTGTINLCAGTNFVTKYCLAANNASEDYAFSFIPSAGFTATGITLTNISGGWTPEMVLQQACGSISDCTATQGVGSTAGNTGTLLFSGASTTITAGTTYFLLVTNTAASTCPGTAETFSLAAAGGTLPVKLSSFTID